MAKTRKQTAGQSRKSHKTRKTAPSPVSAEGPSSPELAAVQAVPVASAEIPLQDNTALVAALGGGEKKDGAAVATGVPSEDPKQQWWYRAPDSKTRKKAEKVAVMRAAGRSDREIAKKMGTTDGTIRQIAFVARRNGWWDSDDEVVDLEEELALSVERKVVRNVNAALDGHMTNWQTHEMTIAAAKGRGIFKGDAAGKDANAAPAMTVVAIKIDMPAIGAGDQKVIEANIGGVPAYVDADVEADEPLELPAQTPDAVTR